jgi:hypothetical protein
MIVFVIESLFLIVCFKILLLPSFLLNDLLF